MNFKNIYFILLILPLVHLFIFQTKKLEINIPSSCYMKFKSNNFLGLVIFLIIFFEKTNLFI